MSRKRAGIITVIMLLAVATCNPAGSTGVQPAIRTYISVPAQKGITATLPITNTGGQAVPQDGHPNAAGMQENVVQREELDRHAPNKQASLHAEMKQPEEDQFPQTPWPLRIATTRVLFQANDPELWPCCLSPDRRWLLLEKPTGTTDVGVEGALSYHTAIDSLWLYDVATGKQTLLTGNGHMPVWSPDSKQIHYFARLPDPRIVEARTIDIRSGNITTSVRSDSHFIHSFLDGTRIIARGGQLAVAQPDGTLSNWTNATMQQSTTSFFGASPDRAYLYLQERANADFILVSRSGERINLGPCRTYAWTPDGRKLVFATPDHNTSEMPQIKVYDLATRNLTTLLNTHNPFDYFPSVGISPDGSVITFVRAYWRSEQPSTFWAMRLDGSAPQQLLENVLFAYWLADGAHLVAMQSPKAPSPQSNAVPPPLLLITIK